MKKKIIVVGGGHSGVEASSVCARLGYDVVLITQNIETIGKMSCNPAIGGVAKGNLVSELDSLGGVMGMAADACGIQFRVLNRSKGPAVWGLRAQEDRIKYLLWIQRYLFKLNNLLIRQGIVEEIILEKGRVKGVKLLDGEEIFSDAVILCPGTFLNGTIFIGDKTYGGGRTNEPPSYLSKSLKEIGLLLKRFKTGTPMRVLASSVDFSVMEKQEGDKDPIPFSIYTKKIKRRQVPCYITYTNKEIHNLILDNLKLSPLFSGKIKGIGPRYCPSMEVKVYKFQDKIRHQIFVEPETVEYREVYLNGLSMSLPLFLQEKILKMLPGFEKAKMTRPAYAIEYDLVDPKQLNKNLMLKDIKGLFLAGQINGTSGYEEAAVQGFMAGINACLYLKGEEPFILKREESYIGILIDDIINLGIDEPYRMFTSRAEYRLSLGFRTARKRLIDYGYKFKLIPKKIYYEIKEFEEKLENFTEELDSKKVYPKKEMKEKILKELNISFDQPITIGSLYRRLRIPLKDLLEILEEDFKQFDGYFERLEENLLYKPYKEREKEDIKRLEEILSIQIPKDFSFKDVPGLNKEMQEKIEKNKPENLRELSQIPGVTPAAILAVYVAFKKRV
jgi:tRNA uridine 5-carboxymethylaminomethyl modification enzyme